MKKGPVQSSLERLAQRLDEEGIPYAVVGGMALSLHGYERMTRDVDVLMSKEGLESFTARCLGRGYVAAFPGARSTFRDTASQVVIEVLTSGDYPGDGKPKPVSFPDPTAASVDAEGIRVVSLPKLIELKLASGMSAPHRGKDLVDVQELIHRTQIPRDFVDQLDPYVRDKFLELWELAQHPDDEY